MNVAFLIIRLIIGLGIASHGAQKLLGWFGGYGVAGTGGFLESLGFRPGSLFAIAAGLGEIVGGVLVFLGFGGPTGPAIVVLVMLVAIFSVHITKGFLSQFGGWEMPALYIAGALAVAFAGPGAYSLDRAFAITLFGQESQVWYALAAAVVLAGLNLLVRRPVRSAEAASH
jgi:putative oxidoreductase